MGIGLIEITYPLMQVDDNQKLQRIELGNDEDTMPGVMVMMKKENRRKSRLEEDMATSLPRDEGERLPSVTETLHEHGKHVTEGTLGISVPSDGKSFSAPSHPSSKRFAISIFNGSE